LAWPVFPPVQSETIDAPRAAECPVQLEAVVESIRELGEKETAMRGRTNIIEVRIQRCTSTKRS